MAGGFQQHVLDFSVDTSQPCECPELVLTLMDGHFVPMMKAAFIVRYSQT